jgi:hypothetical protein
MYSTEPTYYRQLTTPRFMPADALWTLAMACNVYLTFFKKYNAQQLRALEWKYMIFCYGVPFIPAFTYFFIQTPGRGKVYGSASVCFSMFSSRVGANLQSSSGAGSQVIGTSSVLRHSMALFGLSLP